MKHLQTFILWSNTSQEKKTKKSNKNMKVNFVIIYKEKSIIIMFLHIIYYINIECYYIMPLHASKVYIKYFIYKYFTT